MRLDLNPYHHRYDGIGEDRSLTHDDDSDDSDDDSLHLEPGSACLRPSL